MQRCVIQTQNSVGMVFLTPFSVSPLFAVLSRSLVPVVQLCVCKDTIIKDSLKKMDRPLFRDFWPRFLDSLKGSWGEGLRSSDPGCPGFYATGVCIQMDAKCTNCKTECLLCSRWLMLFSHVTSS